MASAAPVLKLLVIIGIFRAVASTKVLGYPSALEAFRK